MLLLHDSHCTSLPDQTALGPCLARETPQLPQPESLANADANANATNRTGAEKISASIMHDSIERNAKQAYV
jgi:hypothetical protein